MRNLKLTFAALACAVFFTLTGCQKDDVDPIAEESIQLSETDFQITDVNGYENPAITGATENTTFNAQSHDQKDETKTLIYILRRLNLNERQQHAIKSFVVQHEECVRHHRSKIQQHHEEMLKRANAVREELVAAYKAGKISKPELEAKLKTLQEKLREEMQKHHDKQLHIRIMRQCRSQLFARIESVLGPEQLAKWKRWKMHL
ncbi:MAG: hypothetical protein LPK09_10245 [Hymenobacteraceae bacterium]|nr:hypothetical protein [Hymenobacteraceae bacterium]